MKREVLTLTSVRMATLIFKAIKDDGWKLTEISPYVPGHLTTWTFQRSSRLVDLEQQEKEN